MQLAFFFVILVYSVFFLPYKFSANTLIALFFIFLIPIFSKFGAYQYDMLVYSNYIDAGVFKAELYYLKEFIFWGMLFLMSFFFPAELVFLSIDYFLIFLLLNSFKNLNIPLKYLLPFFLFFPVVLGFENIYRSFIAVVVLIYAFSINHKMLIKKLFLILISIFIHNAAIIFAPLLFFTNDRRNRIFKIVSVIVACSFYIIFEYLFINFTDYSQDQLISGADYRFYYFSIISGICVGYFFLSRLAKKINYPFLSTLIMASIISGMSTTLPSTLSERISLMIFVFIAPIIFKLISSVYSKKREVIVSLCLLFILIPTFLFSSVLAFVI